jgi:hypothetical protein
MEMRVSAQNSGGNARQTFVIVYGSVVSVKGLKISNQI